MAEDRLDNSLGVILAATVSVLVLCYMAIPTITTAIASLSESAGEKYGALLGLVVTLMIIGLIIVILRGYNSKSR